MLELIPARYYIMKDEDFVQSTKYFQHKKNRAPKQALKEASMSAKRRKLDPKASKSVKELHQEALKEEEFIETSDVDEKDECTNIEEVSSGKPFLKVDIGTVKSIPLFELRERLRSKIQHMKVARKAPTEEKEAKKCDDKVEEDSKMRKRLEQKKKKRIDKTRVAQSANSSKLMEEAGSNSIVPGHVNFNRLEFGLKQKGSSKHRKNDLKILLAKAEMHHKKIEAISENDFKKGEELKRKIKWRNALEKAEGIKQKDDPVLLQRTLKKIEKRKKTSQKEWLNRLDVQKKHKEKRQEKREKNIKDRINQKKTRALGKSGGKRKGRKKKVIMIRS